MWPDGREQISRGTKKNKGDRWLRHHHEYRGIITPLLHHFITHHVSWAPLKLNIIQNSASGWTCAASNELLGCWKSGYLNTEVWSNATGVGANAPMLWFCVHYHTETPSVVYNNTNFFAINTFITISYGQILDKVITQSLLPFITNLFWTLSSLSTFCQR